MRGKPCDVPDLWVPLQLRVVRVNQDAPYIFLTMGQTRSGLSFLQVVQECLGEPELVQQFERLYQIKVVESRSPIERMVDQACGREPSLDGMCAFVAFVYECVWTRFAPLDQP